MGSRRERPAPRRRRRPRRSGLAGPPCESSAARIVGTATIVNRGNARVGSTTGLLALASGSGADATGVLTFSVPSLRPQHSSRVRFATRPLRAPLIRSGAYELLVCTDIYGRIRRFARKTNCSIAETLSISTANLPQASRAVPKTIIRAGGASVSRSATGVFRFLSTVTHSTFQCRLDATPWLACRSPERSNELANGRHAFDVRAVSPTGDQDPPRLTRR